MKRILIIGGLVAVVLAAVVSFYASSQPDGLEKVAADHGILPRSGSRPPPPRRWRATALSGVGRRARRRRGCWPRRRGGDRSGRLRPVLRRAGVGPEPDRTPAARLRRRRVGRASGEPGREARRDHGIRLRRRADATGVDPGLRRVRRCCWSLLVAVSGCGPARIAAESGHRGPVRGVRSGVAVRRPRPSGCAGLSVSGHVGRVEHPGQGLAGCAGCDAAGGHDLAGRHGRRACRHCGCPPRSWRSSRSSSATSTWSPTSTAHADRPSRRAGSAPASTRSWPVLATGLGALFVRSFERGERVHLALVSRGYDGRLPAPDAGSCRVLVAGRSCCR